MNKDNENTLDDNVQADEQAKNPLEFWKKDDSVKADLRKADERFRVKVFYEQFKWAEIFARVSSYVLPVVSIGSGLVCVASVAQSLLPWWFVSYPIAFLLLTGWELAKGKLINTTSEISYRNIKKGLWLMPLCLVFAGLSAYVSITGAEQAHAELNDKTASIETDYKAIADSVGTHYDSLVSIEQIALDTYKKKVTWDGGINMSNKTTKAVLLAHTEEISRLKKTKGKSIDDVTAKSKTALKTASKDFEEHKGLVLGVIAFIELAILFANWFPVHFDYMTHKEAALIKRKLGAGKIELDNLDVQTILMHFANGSFQVPQTQLAPIASNQNTKGMGFQIGSGGSAPDASKSQPTAENKKPDAKLPDGHKACDNCGKAYEAKVSWQRFCKTQCNHEYNKFNLKK